jgi:DNA gyrase subunit B
VITHRLVESDADSPAAVAEHVKAMPANGYTFEVVETTDEAVRIKVIEVETSAAHEVAVPLELLASPIYAHVRRTHQKLRDVLGTQPPFSLKLGKKEGEAATFEELRDRAIELAKEGLQISRFKGLGEMNHEQLWETTMDPARRMLVRVDVEDASRADLWFSRLMGDQVEPRRDFIEQNAQDVRFLDV